MKIIIDTDSKEMMVEGLNPERMGLYSKRAFEVLSEQWLRVGWSQKYSYTFSWFGRPIIQLPEDLMRIQEVIYQIKPDVIVETGVAHGGSLIYYATLFQAMNKGRVIGIDIEIRSHNRTAIENHPLSSRITLVEANSIGQATFEQVKSLINSDEKVMVILDSCHTKEHVLAELELYKELIDENSYIVVQDGAMRQLHDVPGGEDDWVHNNPIEAVHEFLNNNKDFHLETPKRLFCESNLTQDITYWPDAWLRRKAKIIK